MLRIRLFRVGKKKQPAYRIVVADVRAPRDGAIVEQVGHYNPLTDPPTIVLNAERVKHWLGVGARPSDTVDRILQKEGIVEKAGS
ncbi:MAG: 30S ribosomal protein S16 [Chloroflexi bacterium]|nr:30S ribosomal protein S16 [Chloroflexota bacterium]